MDKTHAGTGGQVGRKGHKSQRGRGEIYDEPKSQRVILWLTPTALRILIGLTQGRSRSQTVEEILRKTGTDPEQTTDETK